MDIIKEILNFIFSIILSLAAMKSLTLLLLSWIVNCITCLMYIIVNIIGRFIIFGVFYLIAYPFTRNSDDVKMKICACCSRYMPDNYWTRCYSKSCGHTICYDCACEYGSFEYAGNIADKLCKKLWKSINNK